MLSRIDIERELGKGINIVPLVRDNIKENSINLTASKYAWTMGQGQIRHNGNGYFEKVPTNMHDHSFYLYKGDPCCKYAIVNGLKQDYILLLPHVSTIIETEEVIAVEDYIGGAVHSKVGLVAKGIGDLGTMLGPKFCGHLMITLHNITDEIIALPLGTTIASLSFNYLDTPIKERTSATTSGHVDKFSELGIRVDSSVRSELTADWKASIESVRSKMKESSSYQKLQKKLKEAKRETIRQYFTKEQLLTYAIVIGGFVALGGIAKGADILLKTDIWFDRFINVGCSGIVIVILGALYHWRSGRNRR